MFICSSIIRVSEKVNPKKQIKEHNFTKLNPQCSLLWGKTFVIVSATSASGGIV